MYQQLFAREYSVQYTNIHLEIFTSRGAKCLPCQIDEVCYAPTRGREGFYADTASWEKFMDILEQRYGKRPGLEQLIEEFHQAGKEYVRVSTEMSSGDLMTLSNSELRDRFLHYFQEAVTYTTYLCNAFFLNELFSERGGMLLQEKFLDEAHRQEIYTALFTPGKKVGVLEFQEKLRIYQQNGVTALPDDIAAAFVEEYGWIPCMDVHSDLWTVADVQDFYRHLAKVSDPLLTAEAAGQMAGLSMEEIEYFSLIRLLAEVKDVRDVYRRQGVWKSYPLYEEIAKRFGITRAECGFLSEIEIVQGLEENTLPLSKEKIRQRQDGFLIYRDNNVWEVTAEPDFIAAFAANHWEDVTHAAVISGRGASPGIVQGSVCLVRGVKELTKMFPGAVLVAVATNPEYTPAFHKAIAIVTDEGGMTSHAAIVARELKIPCIVGTKQATHVLEDGDLVEVDATKGTITKLEK